VQDLACEALDGLSGWKGWVSAGRGYVSAVKWLPVSANSLGMSELLLTRTGLNINYQTGLRPVDGR
jgi:hypothetical protein